MAGAAGRRGRGSGRNPAMTAPAKNRAPAEVRTWPPPVPEIPAGAEAGAAASFTAGWRSLAEAARIAAGRAEARSMWPIDKLLQSATSHFIWSRRKSGDAAYYRRHVERTNSWLPELSPLIPAAPPGGGLRVMGGDRRHWCADRNGGGEFRDFPAAQWCEDCTPEGAAGRLLSSYLRRDWGRETFPVANPARYFQEAAADYHRRSGGSGR